MKARLTKRSFDPNEEVNILQSALSRAASMISPLGAEEMSLSRALQWKVWLQNKVKTKIDLFNELSNAPRPLTYVPGPTQLAFHLAQERTRQTVGGWRAGKSKSMAAEILPVILQDNAHVWIVANDYKLAEPEFGYVYEWLQWLGCPLTEGEGAQVSTPLNGRWSMRLPWGARLETQSADDIKKIEAGNLDIAACAEAGQMSVQILDRLRGRVMEKRGDILLSGSLEGANYWYIESFEKFRRGDTDVSWKSFSIPSWENIIVFPGGREDPEIKYLENTLPEDIFKLKVCAEVAKSSEIVFPEFDTKRHIVPIDFGTVDQFGIPVSRATAFKDEVTGEVTQWSIPHISPVEVAVDPGYAGAYAVLFIARGEYDIFVLDEVYAKGVVAEDVITMCKQMKWWPLVKGGVIDVAGRQHQGMASHQEIWAMRENGGIHLRSQFVPIADGIQRLRTFLRDPATRQPRIWVAPRCEGLIREFSQYKYRASRENRAEREEPIDNNNHSIKALVYYLVDKFGFSGTEFQQVVSESYIQQARTPWNEKPFQPFEE